MDWIANLSLALSFSPICTISIWHNLLMSCGDGTCGWTYSALRFVRRHGWLCVRLHSGLVLFVLVLFVLVLFVLFAGVCEGARSRAA